MKTNEKCETEILAQEQAERLIEQYVQIRKQLGINQSELTRITGMARPSINRYEKGKLMPTIRAMDRLLAPLGYQLAIVPIENEESANEE